MGTQLSIFNEIISPKVIMHNYLVTASFANLELNSMRIFLLMLAKLDRFADDVKPVRVYLHDIDPAFNKKSRFELIMKAIDDLKDKMKDIKILSLQEGRKKYERMTVIDNLSYVEKTDYIQGEFGRAVAPYIIQLTKNFTQAELRELLTLKSSYAIRFYMLVKSLYKENQVYKTKVSDLKLMLMGNTDLYSDYRNFRMRVLEPAKEALSKTSAAFEYIEEKTGRSYTDITIRPVEPKTAQFKWSMTEELKAKLDKYSVNLSQVSKMLQDKSISEEYCHYVICEKEKDKRVETIGGAIHAAITNKTLLDKFVKSKTPPVHKTTSKATLLPAHQVISLQQAQQMYEEEKPKYPFPGFVKAIKTGRNILVEGYTY